MGDTATSSSPIANNEDWETTCLIYSDGDVSNSSLKTTFESDAKHSAEQYNDATIEAGYPALVENRSHDRALSVATIEMPIHAAQTAIFAQPEPLQPNCFRFWMLTEVPILKVSFMYKDHVNGDDDEGNEGFPMSVSISLVSPYPETWPVHEEEIWLKWLNKQADSIRSEQLTSYSVCAFVEHNALDYFRCIQLPETDECSGDDASLAALMVMFPEPAATHWQGHKLDSLVFDPTSGVLMLHGADGTKKRTTKGALWPPRGGNEKWDEVGERMWLHPAILKHELWFPRACPICFDDYIARDMVRLECKHHVCRGCFTMYVSTQAREIERFRQHDLPFQCPVLKCRKGIKVLGTVKAYLTAEEMERVRVWYYDLTHPVSRCMPECLDCKGAMRKNTPDSFMAACNICGVKRCEFCFERIRNENVEHLATTCKGAETLKLARRYYRASPELQERCEAKYPWIKAYAEARVASAVAIRDWLSRKEGQVCPTCSNGVVRDEGCFHIHCNCGTHFCYECGDELFPPYYGTHHCWEESRGREDHR